MKLLLVTFSDNADHQDTLFGMFEELKNNYQDVEPYLLAIKTPKVNLEMSKNTWLVDCPKRPGITKKTFDLKELFAIISKIKNEKFDAIWFESLHLWNLPIMKAVKGTTAIYHVIHEVIPHEGDRQERQVDFFNKLLVRLSDTIVLRNKTFIDEMIKRYSVSSDRIKYVELWRRYPQYTQPSYSKRVLFFGRINPYKGADNLLKLVQQSPDVIFDVVGKVDPEMEAVVNQLRDQPNVHLETGYVSEERMKQAFINADWVVVPYNSASQSGVIIDAYKYSRPVIAFDVGAISEQVDPGKSGFLIPAADIDAFSIAINKAICMDETEYQKMCKYAWEYGNLKYGVAGATERFLRVFD